MANSLLHVVVISTMVVNCAIRFKVSSCKDDDTKHVTFVLADWMHAGGDDNLNQHLMEYGNVYGDFYQDFYRPLIMRLKQYENEDCFNTSLVALYRESVFVLDIVNTREMNAMSRSFHFYEYTDADWLYLLDWLNEYAKQIANRTSTLVFFTKSFPKYITSKLNDIQLQDGASVIIVSDVVEVLSSLTQFPKHHRVYMTVATSHLLNLPVFSPRSVPQYTSNYALLSTIRNKRYTHYEFLRNTPSNMSDEDTSCLGNKTICILYKSEEINVVAKFRSFLVRLDNHLVTVNGNNLQMQFRFLQYVEFSYESTSPRPFTFPLNSKFEHVTFTRDFFTYVPDVFRDPKKQYVFIHAIRDSSDYSLMKTRMRRRELTYIGLKQNRQQNVSPFRESGAHDDVIQINPRDLDSDEFIGLLVRTLIEKCRTK